MRRWRQFLHQVWNASLILMTDRSMCARSKQKSGMSKRVEDKGGIFVKQWGTGRFAIWSATLWNYIQLGKSCFRVWCLEIRVWWLIVWWKFLGSNLARFFFRQKGYVSTLQQANEYVAMTDGRNEYHLDESNQPVETAKAWMFVVFFSRDPSCSCQCYPGSKKLTTKKLSVPPFLWILQVEALVVVFWYSACDLLLIIDEKRWYLHLRFQNSRIFEPSYLTCYRCT
jgi:hypothetical protein